MPDLTLKEKLEDINRSKQNIKQALTRKVLDYHKDRQQDARV